MEFMPYLKGLVGPVGVLVGDANWRNNETKALCKDIEMAPGSGGSGSSGSGGSSSSGASDFFAKTKDKKKKKKKTAAAFSSSSPPLTEHPLPFKAWDSSRNKYHGPEAFQYSCNFDRVFVHRNRPEQMQAQQEQDSGATSAVAAVAAVAPVVLRVDSIAPVGDMPTRAGGREFFLSDHFGVQVDLAFSEP